MMRVLLDTNVLINAERGEFSYPKRILDLIKQRKITAVISHAVKRENQLLVSRLVKDKRLAQEIKDYLSSAEEVEPEMAGVMLEDEEDLKMVDAALGGGAQFLITDDKHLLDVEEHDGIRMVTPAQFWQWWEKQEDASGKTWKNWINQVTKG